MSNRKRPLRTTRQQAHIAASRQALTLLEDRARRMIAERAHDFSGDWCVRCALPLWAAHRPCVPSTDCDPVELRRVEMECRGC